MSQVLQECGIKRYICLIYLGRETSYISCLHDNALSYLAVRELLTCCNFFFERSGILEVASFLVREKKVGLESVDV